LYSWLDSRPHTPLHTTFTNIRNIGVHKSQLMSE
jgi:hypothetical protein